jgi:hypothetical protein
MGNYNLLQRLKFDTQRSLAFGSIGAGYTKVGTALAFPANQFMVSNFTNTPLQFSTDGITDHFVLAAGAQWINDDKANNIFLPIGDALWVKELTGAPASGAVYFSVIYGGD